MAVRITQGFLRTVERVVHGETCGDAFAWQTYNSRDGVRHGSGSPL